MSQVTRTATGKLFPGNPTSVLVTRQVTPNITTFSVPFARFGVIAFGGRGTLSRLQNGALAIFSPVALSDEVKAKVNELGGKVSYIIAPDIEHHLFIGAWKEAYPSAKVIAPEGLLEKRKKQGNEETPFDYIFTKQNKRVIQLPADFTQTFDIEYVDGHANKEIVLYHKQDKTLIEADLLFNLPANEQYSKHGGNAVPNFWTKFFMNFTRTEPAYETGQKRFIWHMMAKDRASFADSVKRVSQFDFEKIIPCHGDVIESGGNDVFSRLFAWHLI